MLSTAVLEPYFFVNPLTTTAGAMPVLAAPISLGTSSNG